MKITRRFTHINPFAVMNIWFIPALNYTMLKVVGMKMHSELIWWIALPIIFLAWLVFTFKIVKQ
jgi:hypothetical protein